MSETSNIGELAEKIGVTIKNQDFLQQAMTHRSYLNENRNYRLDHNERLEFLGDAVLELVVTRYLYDNFTNPEGEMTAWRAALVNGEMLARVAGELDVEPHLMMSKGESKDTGRARNYLLANSIEAIIGAIYLDQDYDTAADFIARVILIHMDEVLEKKLYLDSKSYFQEKAQEHMSITPHYEVIEEAGPDHDRHFTVAVYLDKEKVGVGDGPSKQDAQRAAAQDGLEQKDWL